MVNVSRYFANPEHVVELAPGEKLFSQGDEGEAMYAVLEGDLDIIMGDKIVDRASAGRLVGEMAIIESAPRSATLVAVTPCRLAEVDRRHFLFMVHESPTFAVDVMREMADRLRRYRASEVAQ